MSSKWRESHRAGSVASSVFAEGITAVAGDDAEALHRLLTSTDKRLLLGTEVLPSTKLGRNLYFGKPTEGGILLSRQLLSSFEVGDTMLHLAARNDKPHATRTLLEFGANHGATNRVAQTPVERASRACKAVILNFIATPSVVPNTPLSPAQQLLQQLEAPDTNPASSPGLEHKTLRRPAVPSGRRAQTTATRTPLRSSMTSTSSPALAITPPAVPTPNLAPTSTAAQGRHPKATVAVLAPSEAKLSAPTAANCGETLTPQERTDQRNAIAASNARARAKAEARAREVAIARAKAEAETQAREDMQVREYAEAEARARANAEASMRAEAEERARQEVRIRDAEARSRAETEARMRAEAEAQAREEAEARARAAENEMRALVEAEAQARKDAEARDAHTRALAKAEAGRAQARAQAEAEAQVRAESEARARAEAEARARAEAEAVHEPRQAVHEPKQKYVLMKKQRRAHARASSNSRRSTNTC